MVFWGLDVSMIAYIDMILSDVWLCQWLCNVYWQGLIVGHNLSDVMFECVCGYEMYIDTVLSWGIIWEIWFLTVAVVM